MRWALVLSGGGARGLAHIGLVRELERRAVPRPSLVAGTSMGAIVGAMYASGWDSARMSDYVGGFDFKDFVDNPSFRLPDLALSRILQAGTALGAVLKGGAVDSGRRALAELERILGRVDIESLSTPFACVSSDLVSGRAVVHSSGPLAEAVRASISFPGVFAPVRRDGLVLVDGGVLNNMPCDVARERGYKRILASDVSPFGPAEPGSLDKAMGLLLRCFDVSAEKAQSSTAELAELVVTVRSDRAAFDFDDPLSVVALGERAARESSRELDRFFARGPSRAAAVLGRLWPWKPSTDR